MAPLVQSTSGQGVQQARLPLGVLPFRSSKLVGQHKSPKQYLQFPQPARPLRVSQAGPDDKEPLPWERNEKLKQLANESGELPFGVYLLGASVVAIAAVGSIFEIIYKNPLFGIIPPSSPFWLPILGFFGVTGLPTAGFLFFKAINSANAESDRQNKADGY